MSDPGPGFNFKRSLGSSCEIIISKPDSPRDGRVEVKLWGVSPAPERLLRACRCWPKGGEQAIKVAHRRLALMYHPARNPGSAPKKNSKRPQRLTTSERFRGTVPTGTPSGIGCRRARLLVSIPKAFQGPRRHLGYSSVSATCLAAEATSGGTTAPNAATTCFDLN